MPDTLTAAAPDEPPAGAPAPSLPVILERLRDTAATLPAPPPTAPATYTVADLARLTQCSERHIWRLADLDLIPGKLRLGRLVRFHKPTVDAWLASGAPSNRRARR
jgi:excisionase family DNA binding protein